MSNAGNPGNPSNASPGDTGPDATNSDPSTSDPSNSSDPATTNSDDCAQIPTASHAVLEVSIKLIVRVPLTTDAAGQLPNKLTLTSEDGSYTKTLTFASDCQPGADGGSVLTFDGLTDGHTYSMQGEDDRGTYTVFSNIPYHELVPRLGDGSTDSSSPSTPPDPGGGSSADSADGTVGGG
jgi:hypothetical protein